MSLLTALPTVDDATRREFLALLAAAGLVTGCGATADGPPAPESRSVRHLAGETTVLGAPERAVAMFTTDTELLVSLDVVPVAGGGFSTGPLQPWVVEHVERLGAPLPERFDLVDGVPVELVASYRPELICSLFEGSLEVSTQLSAIAPTLHLIDKDFEDPRWWDRHLAALATLLGRTELAQKRLAEKRERLDAAVAAAPLAGIRFAMVSAGENDATVTAFGELSGQAAFLQSLGATNVYAGPEDGTGIDYAYSVELLGGFADTDVLVVLEYSDGYDQQAQVPPSPLFATLPAVAGGRVAGLTGAQSFSLTPVTWLSTTTALSVVDTVTAAAGR